MIDLPYFHHIKNGHSINVDRLFVLLLFNKYLLAMVCSKYLVPPEPLTLASHTSTQQRVCTWRGRGLGTLLGNDVLTSEFENQWKYLGMLP